MRLSPILWVFFITQAAFANLFVDGVSTVAAPVHFAICATDNAVKLIRSENIKEVKLNTKRCPSGMQLLGYVLLRQITQKLAAKYGPVYPNEIMLKATSETPNSGKTLVINLIGRAPSDLRRYEGLENAEIITPKNEKELNAFLSNVAPQSLDMIAIDTHGSAVFGDTNIEVMDIDKVTKFDLLKDSGKVVHFGCESMSDCSLDRTLEFVQKLSPKNVQIFGSEGSVVGLTMMSRIGLVLSELTSKPGDNLSSIIFQKVKNSGAKRVLSVKTGCKALLQ